MSLFAAETANLTNAPNQDMVASQVTKRPVGIETLSNTRRMTDRALKARFSYGRANGRAVWLPVTGSGSFNPVRPAASEIETSGGRFLKPTTRRPVMAHTLQAESALVSPELKTTSLIVAECFGKRHDSVLRTIEALEIPEEYRLHNFVETFHEVHGPNGATRKFKAYEMTRDGFALLVMGFTGKRAMHWKIRFLEAFNAMEAELSKPEPDTLPFSMADLTDEAYLLLEMAREAYSAAGRMQHQASCLFSKAQHNKAFGPKSIPSPERKTLVRAHVRRLPKQGKGLGDG